jgi:hypothetical protein
LGLLVGLSEAGVAIAGQPLDLFQHSCLIWKARLVQQLAELVCNSTNPSAQYSHIIMHCVHRLEAIGHSVLDGGKELRLLSVEPLFREELRILQAPKPLVKSRDCVDCSDLEFSVIFLCNQTPRDVNKLAFDVLVEAELIHVG